MGGTLYCVMVVVPGAVRYLKGFGVRDSKDTVLTIDDKHKAKHYKTFAGAERAMRRTERAGCNTSFVSEV